MAKKKRYMKSGRGRLSPKGVKKLNEGKLKNVIEGRRKREAAQPKPTPKPKHKPVNTKAPSASKLRKQIQKSIRK